MKIQKQSHKLRLISIVGLALLSAVVAAYFLYFKSGAPLRSGESSNTPSINYGTPTDEQTKAGNAAKDATIKNSGGATDETTSSNPKQPTQTSDSTTTDKLATTITVHETNGSTVYIRNEISGVHSTGNCTLTLTKGDKTVTKESGIQPLAKVSTCRGFNIPTSELSPGTWYITLTVTIGDQKGNAKASVDV